MPKKSGLGKGFGINALIPEVKEEEVKKADFMLDINLITTNKSQPRKKFDGEKLNALASSIKIHGIVQPIVVVKEGEFYRIVAGERRFRAAKQLKLKEVPVVVGNYSDREIHEIALVENLQREDLNPIEEAMGIKQLMEKFSLTQEEASDKIGKSRSAVANTLRLLDLDKRVVKMIEEAKLSAGHARALLSVKDAQKQAELAEFVAENGLNVRQTENLVKKDLTKKEKSKIKNDKNIENAVKEQSKHLEEKYGVKIKVTYSDNYKGKIQFSFAGKEEMNNLFDKLSK